MTISEMLKYLIVKNGMTQTEVSIKTNVNSATISRALRGKFNPNYENGKAIEALYKEVVENQKAS